MRRFITPEVFVLINDIIYNDLKKLKIVCNLVQFSNQLHPGFHKGHANFTFTIQIITMLRILSFYLCYLVEMTFSTV